MKKLLLGLSIIAGCSLAPSASALAAARTYDCSKPGNANKSACKSAAKVAKAAAKPATAAKPAVTKVSSTTTTRTVTQKNYDCSKAGNKNKGACKSATTVAAKPDVKQTTVATTTRHYDCTKAGNAGKAQCKVSVASKATVSKPVAAARRTPAARAGSGKGSDKVENNIAAGAIAQCKDGLYSHAKDRTGACSRHGGVSKWM